MKTVAIITARGGSKRIPKKNIRPFLGRPMLAYAFQAVADAGVFDEIMVSTDDPEIADVARSLGAAVPFLRSAEAASDTATTADALIDALGAYERSGRVFDLLACVYPCVPLLDGQIIREAFAAFCAGDADSLMPVCRYGHPVQRALRMAQDGFLVYAQPQNAQKRTQDLEPFYHDAGMFYLARVPRFLATSSLTAGKVMPFEMPENSVQDIDTIDDWRMAEIKHRMKYGA